MPYPALFGSYSFGRQKLSSESWRSWQKRLTGVGLERVKSGVGKRAGKGEHYILFRLDLKAGPPYLRTYLTSSLAWSPNRTLAKTGAYGPMKALVKKIKSDFPDIILELDGRT